MRNLSQEFKEKLELTKLRFGDRLQISPFQGRQKVIELNRTSFLFSSEVKSLKTNYFELPSLKNQDLKFELCLSHLEEESSQAEDGVYILRSLGKDPFIHNGNYCFEAILERGDLIQLGFNELRYYATKEEERDQQKSLFESSLPILIEGETGTGKSSLAKKIHQASLRIGQFEQLNISSLNPGLIESELFGHLKGSFTGADRQRLGAFRMAHKGTLFLDEIDSLSLAIQTKLLLFLDHKRVRAVGSDQDYSCDVRLIFASGKSLEEMVKEGSFRKDLFYRLKSGFFIHLSPLRSSPDKILKAIEGFEEEHDVLFSWELKKIYQQHSWPGNYRELLSHLEKKKALAEKRKIEFDFQDHGLEKDEVLNELPSFLNMNEVKKKYIRRVYWKCQGNINETATILGLTKSTIKKFLAA